MKIFRTDWRNAIVFIIAGALMIFGEKSKALNTHVYMVGSIGIVIFFTFVILLITLFSYASITNTTLKFVYLLFYRRTIDINSITEINDQPTYKAAKKSFRSLYIFYKDKNNAPKYIELRITIFPEKTLAALIKELKRINPRIELNKYSEKLMNSVS